MTKSAKTAPFQTRRLANGLTVLTVPREGTEAATVSFLFRAGSRYESKETNGLAHFNEHMVFKGGKRYPDHTAVTQVFDKIGAIMNAYTSEEVTAFWAKTRSAHIPEVADVFTDILTTAHYNPKELEKERGVIIEEINMYEDDPASDIYQVLEKVSYPDHPLGRPTLGPKENIRRFTPNDFRKYSKVHHTPDRGVLVIAGKVDGYDEAKLDQVLARLSGNSTVAADPAEFVQTSPRLSLKRKKTEQTHLAFAVRAPSLSDKSAVPVLNVLVQLLGGSMSSRLFTEIREKRGLAYYVRAMRDAKIDTGLLIITAGVRNNQAHEATAAIVNELKRLRDGDLPRAELEMHKDSLLGKLALVWEDSQALAEFYGQQLLLLGEIKTTEKILKELAAVTRDQVIDLAKQIVVDEGLSAAAIGPQDEKKLQAELSFG